MSKDYMAMNFKRQSVRNEKNIMNYYINDFFTLLILIKFDPIPHAKLFYDLE